MRIIVLINSLYTGGAEFSTLAFYGRLRNRGYTIKLVCYKVASPSYDLNDFGIEAVAYLKGKSFWARLADLNSIIQEFKPDLIHSVLFEANLLGRLARVKHRNFVHLESIVNEMYSTFRYADPNVTRFKLTGYRLLDWATQLVGVDHFHANGISVSKHYQAKLGISPKRITVIPRGRLSNAFVGSAENRTRVRQEFSAGDRLLLVSVGRQEYQKAHDILIQAIAVLGDLKEKIKLVIVGRDGNFSAHIHDVINRNHLQEYVILAGHRNDVPSILAAANIFVFPSRFEGLPGALIEAEAAGLPIICSEIPNNREVAEENVNALFVAVDDSVSLAQQIKLLVSNENKRKLFSENSLVIFNQKYQLEEVHQRMEDLLKKLVDNIDASGK
jgi:glycosyltransferase involved in cell wall biosynthesis